ncbi:MAG: transcriptional repressor [Prevotella sp.]|nr:transcriptional repressor [Prevotella sp.]
MKDSIRGVVRGILDQYLERNHYRRTPERYAILDAVYSINGHFSLEQLSARLEKDNFRVSRATLYNTMRLLLELRLVLRHRFQSGTKYEACYEHDDHCHQICTICGKVTELQVPELAQSIMNTKLKRFRKDGFSLYIYGVCSSCRAKITRNLTLKNKEKK